MTCPRCGGNTRKRRVKSIAIERCPGCGGSWYSADMLRLLKDRERAGDYRWIDIDLWRHAGQFRAGRQERLACPKDRTVMTTVRYGDSRIRVNICTRCRGIWLDKGDYERILRYLENKVDSETLGGYVHDLKDEFLEIFTGPESAASELADFTKVLHLLELRFVVQHSTIATALRSAAKGVPGA